MSSEEIIAIIIEDKTYNVSKSKLIEKSDYFRALYNSGMKESEEDSVQLQGLSAHGLELVIEFINTSKVHFDNETLEDLVETASFLQVTSILKLLLSEVKVDNCVELYKLSEMYGISDLMNASLRFMVCHYHPMLRRQEFRHLPNTLHQQIREMRLKGTAVLVAVGDFFSSTLDQAPNESWSMLRYDEIAQRWLPLPNSLPPDMVNVRGYGSIVLNNYLFIVGGYRMTSQEIAAAHCYNPCKNEWNRIAPMNQKRSNFKLLAVSEKLYAVGGQSLCNVECYNPEMDWWSFVASMPDPLVEFSACECKGMIYVMGGYTTRDRNMNILRYCPTSDAWTVLESCEVHIRKQQMVSVEDTIYLVGGCIHEKGGSRKGSHAEDMLTVQSYNVTTREWLHLKENTSKSGLNLTCTLHNDGIYIISRDIAPSTSLEHRVFLKYNLFSDMWEAFRRFPAFGQNILLCSLYYPDVI
ncbi:kelch-like protein 42 [Carcharodon carcharias]|uniref:kelch-like protein 42 n=1 Tax=Carcharodon carcharias TaxID=13397 RepID=UPI001B7DD567|nr:kelch-like protein 42 [Carcharodon carcharias]XP_041072445.1 kelch-like protein 42 [Carcharodon carcharias]